MDSPEAEQRAVVDPHHEPTALANLRPVERFVRVPRVANARSSESLGSLFFEFSCGKR